MTKIVIALTVLLLLLLAGNFGLVWAVVVYNTPTTLSSNVLTAKATGDPVQVSSADFYYDSNGLLQLRNRGAQMSMDWVGGSADTCSASGTCSADAGGSAGRRRLLQDTGSNTLSSTPNTVDMQTTQFTPTCNFSSPDFYTNSSYFFTGTCTFTKLVQMRTIVLPMLSSKTSAQVGGGIIDAAAWKAGAQTVYKGCYSGTSSNWNQNILSSATSLANCEALAVTGSDAASTRAYSYFGFTGSATNTSGICYACSNISASCTPMASGSSNCSNVAGIRVFQLQRSPNRYQIAGPGAMANSPTPIPGGAPAAPAWSYVTLAITRVDYVKNVFRDASNTLTICQANLLRFYVTPMTASGSVTSVSGTNSSYVDICLTPMSKAASFGAGPTTWIGNYTVHSTGKSSTFVTSAGAPAYYDRPSVGTSFATPDNTDFQSVLSYFALNGPSGPYIDYSNLQYDANLFELPCTKKGISWRFRDYYSNQGCPAWDPGNTSAQSNCSWTMAESSNYGGAAGLNYCILAMDAFTPNEPVYTFDNQLSFLTNTGRSLAAIQKTQTAFGDNGVPPLYNYVSGGGNSLWKDYFNTSDDATAATSGYPWFTSNRPISLSVATSRRHLLAADPTVGSTVSFNVTTSTSTTFVSFLYVGDCANTNGQASNGYDSTTAKTCAPITGSCKNLGANMIARVCKCVTTPNASKFCNAGAAYCRQDGCYQQSSGGSVSGSIMAA